jgi:hypothetical protein
MIRDVRLRPSLLFHLKRLVRIFDELAMRDRGIARGF